MSYIGLERSSSIANRIEVDFYPCTIAAVIQVFFDGKSVSDYLNMCWGELAGSTPSAMKVQICADSALDVFSKEIRKHYGRNSLAASPEVMCILKKMIVSEKMEEAVYYARRLLALCGSWTITAEVADVMRCPEKQAPAETPSFNFHAHSLPQAGPNAGLHVASTFGSYFKEQADKIGTSSESGGNPNELYCPSFVTYLCEQALPYFPILTKVMDQATGILPEATTNLGNPVDSVTQLHDWVVPMSQIGPSSNTDGILNFI